MDVKKLLATGLLAAASLLSFNASALTVPFSLSGGWLSGSETQTFPSGPGQISFIETDGTIPGTFHEIRWGVPSTLTGNGERSGLRLDNESGFITADGAPVLLSTLTHFNNVIQSGSSSLLSVILRSQLQLGLLGDITDFTINFRETRNFVLPCPPPNPNGSECDDYFTLIGGLPTVDFVVNGILYRLEVFLVPGEGVEIVDGVFYTREGGNSQLFTYGRLFTVAEPGALAFLGLGLLAFGAARRSR